MVLSVMVVGKDGNVVFYSVTYIKDWKAPLPVFIEGRLPLLY